MASPLEVLKAAAKTVGKRIVGDNSGTQIEEGMKNKDAVDPNKAASKLGGYTKKLGVDPILENKAAKEKALKELE
jgi:hypothetical protein